MCCGELGAHTLISQLICISQPLEHLFRQQCMTISHGFWSLNLMCSAFSTTLQGCQPFLEHVTALLCPRTSGVITCLLSSDSTTMVRDQIGTRSDNACFRRFWLTSELLPVGVLMTQLALVQQQSHVLLACSHETYFAFNLIVSCTMQV